MFNFNKNTAFTLAEMLVVLGLIGAISALTIPTLAYNYRSKVLEEQFRSTYSDVRQIGALINYEKGDVGEYANKISFTAWQKDFVSRLNGGNNLLGSESPSALQTKYTQTLKDGGGSPGLWAFNLSGGNQQKVCLARAITMNPKLLIVSEPTRGIDIGAKKLVLELLAKMNREQGMTIVMVSSELQELRSVSDRIAIVSEGKLVDVLAPNASDADSGLAMSGMKPSEHNKKEG